MELETIAKKWNELKVAISTIYEDVKKRYTTLEPLIKYLEEAMLDPEATFENEVDWISAKFKKLDAAYKEGIKFYSERISPLMNGAKLIELIRLSPEYDRFAEILKNSESLKTLSEDTLFKEYKAGLQTSGTKPFKDFTKENTEAFYRLKLRSIESRIDYISEENKINFNIS